MTTFQECEIAKVDEAQRLVGGYAYVSHDEDGLPIVDNEGDFVPTPEELEKAAVGFMLDHRSGDVWHNETLVAKAVESVVLTPEKMDAMGIQKAGMPQGAWWVTWKVLDDTTWDLVQKGLLRSMSIGGRGLRTPVEAVS